ncbi:Ycf66 family protein [Prochlorococcus sp. MIT 1300]|uniref:Ycf66 family protein n=1 Tax=Prochlorococcus sp. MIT 1300 TaxID=3096218 RepID=UPI002A761D9F|nr:Ycf66 family protein [Prochlorococcus sp. MIT 1300]
MINASLNWASIYGIALMVCGAGLYFMRSFKPALARDYDVFFSAIGLLCGGILLVQGWRLDPILQFGNFLLTGTVIFFGYESVRLRGVATDQARRSSYFDEDQPPPSMGGGGFNDRWEDSYDQLEEPQQFRRRFTGQMNDTSDSSEEDFYRPRRTSRAAIPEEAASRRRPSRSEAEPWREQSERSRRMARFGRQNDESESSPSFGERRSLRQDQRRGSRPSPNQQTTRRSSSADTEGSPRQRDLSSTSSGTSRSPRGASMRRSVEDAAFSPSNPRAMGSRTNQDQNSSVSRSSQTPTSVRSDSPQSRSTPRQIRPRDNSSRFDD